MDSGTSVQTIYMPLDNEGTDCWRPVRAERLADNVFKVLDVQPADEEWRFATACPVRVQPKILQGGAEGLQIIGLAD